MSDPLRPQDPNRPQAPQEPLRPKKMVRPKPGTRPAAAQTAAPSPEPLRSEPHKASNPGPEFAEAEVSPGRADLGVQRLKSLIGDAQGALSRHVPEKAGPLLAGARQKLVQVKDAILPPVPPDNDIHDAASGMPAPRPSADYRRIASKGYGLIILTFGVFGGWAAFASIDSAVIAPGVVSVESRRQVVQHLEGGIVAEILVKDGQKVKDGEVLFRLDPTSSLANYDSVRAQLDTLLATEARLEAERGMAAAITFPPNLMARTDNPVVKAALADQQAQFRDRKASLDGQMGILNQRIVQGETEIDGLGREKASAEQQLFYCDDELDGIQKLSDKGLVSKSRLAQLQREKARLQGVIGRNIADTAKAQATISEMRMQIEQITQKQQEEVAQQIVETRQKIADLREKLNISESVLKRIDIRAPRAGIVQNINPKIYTVGAVVRPGDTMLEVVPQNDELIVDAQVPTTDIDRLHGGVDQVEVRFPAFHARTTPLIVGQLRSVSPDRLMDEQTRQPYYQAVISVSNTDIPDEMKSRLRPGMPAEVIFNTGERSVMSYLTRPLTDALTHSFREK
ncbi:HlyD family type I secretion periplasmic adaptor subunit [Aquabacter cavernae]|uniref:HlyD family type I secretion periplasmic adaptor subunit n=1 Tax=Aquabacter cavernae TaxID=2496029 RepID=UPI000F8C4223|nr:HlyD family type I secretion periplasmic adaptor subunit [Aquabacter cavernae]